MVTSWKRYLVRIYDNLRVPLPLLRAGPPEMGRRREAHQANCRMVIEVQLHEGKLVCFKDAHSAIRFVNSLSRLP